MTNVDVSIIIVTYNSEKDIIPCLESIMQSITSVKYEILIVDNDSKDETCKLIRDFIRVENMNNIKLINVPNKGFNAGNNVGLKESQGSYILLLNPDTIIQKNTLEKIFNASKKIQKMGAVGCVMKNIEGEEIFSAGYFPGIKNSIYKIFRKNKIKINKNKVLQKVDFPVGALFFFNKSIIKDIGLMDENFFLYYDETDFAYRMHKKGYKNYLLTSISIIHKYGQSTGTMPTFSIQKNNESYIYYLRKNCSRLVRFCVISIDLIRLFVCYMISSLIKHKSKEYFKYNFYNFIKISFNYKDNEI